MSFQQLFKRMGGDDAPLSSQTAIPTGENGRPIIVRDNLFSDAFQRFKSTNLYSALAEEWRVKAYWEANRRSYLVAFYGSYVANAFSATTAGVMVFFLLELVIPVFALNVALSVASIIWLEWAKREVSGPFWHNGIQFRKWSLSWGLMMFFLFSISAAGSILGTDRAVKEFNPGPEQVDRAAEITALQSQLDTIDAQIAAARATKWAGTTTRPSTKAIAELTEQRAPILERKLEVERAQEEANRTLANLHDADIDVRAYYATLVALILELIFQVCMRYVKYYRFRSIAEFGIIEGPQAAKFLRDDMMEINRDVLPQWLNSRMSMGRPGQFPIGRDESGSMIVADLQPKRVIWDAEGQTSDGSGSDQTLYPKGSDANPGGDPSKSNLKKTESGPHVIVGDSSSLRKKAWNAYYSFTKGAATEATREKNRIRYEQFRYELWDTFGVLCNPRGEGSVAFIQPPESSDPKFKRLVPKRPS